MDDLIAEFLAETNEGLEEIDNDLVKLEQSPNDKDLLSKIFRIMHTIKGTCGFLGLPRLEGVAHKAEDVLGLFRDGVLEVTPEYVTLIFESLDRIKLIIADIEATGSEQEGDDSALKDKLTAVYELAQNGGAAAAEEDPLEAIFRDTPSDYDFMNQSTPNESAASDDGENTASKETAATEAEAEANEAILSIEQISPDSNSSAPEAPPPPATAAQPSQPAPAAQAAAAPVSAQSLRVNVDVLEDLMTMVSELVLTRNQLLQLLREQSESEFTSPLQRLNHVVSDLQEGVMKTRMQPIGNAWAKLPRIIRDISMELGKKIDLQMRGEDTELDRQVLDMIKDPLTHMVRNSGDHGIESPADRAAAGKPETGTIVLNAYHEGGHIIIEISDDGKGLSREKIKQKALANGLATAEELENMSTQQIHQFIFKAGFSTAEKITSVSGRGVGMDVVRTNIEKIGGSIELFSEEGKGSTFLIKIPLTLAIVSALIVESANEKFAIPQLAVRELVMTSADSESRIETIKGAPVFRLRDHLLPLVSLEQLLKLSPENMDILPANVLAADAADDNIVRLDNMAPANAEKGAKSRLDDEARFMDKYIVVTQVGSYTFGIIVDKVFDTEEIVIKPVSSLLKNVEMFSGNTILGDGSVIMILDPSGIAKSSGEIDAADMKDAATEEKSAYADERTSLLLFTAGDNTPLAVPLELVSRLEEVSSDKVEMTGGRMVVQYRGDLMPLIPYQSGMSFAPDSKRPVLVFGDDKRAMGLIVDRIIDITEAHLEIKMESSNAQLMGSTIINEQATDIIDVGYFLRQISTEWFKDHGDEPYKEAAQNNAASRANGHSNGNGRANGNGNGASYKNVLLVEDSPFFRNMLNPILAVSGYKVTMAKNAIEALEICQSGKQFDIIVSDIEMPEMSGFEFAEKIREKDDMRDIPMVALTSHVTQQDMDRGMEAGFSKYIAKFDRETLLTTLSQALSEPSPMERGTA